MTILQVSKVALEGASEQSRTKVLLPEIVRTKHRAIRAQSNKRISANIHLSLDTVDPRKYYKTSDWTGRFERIVESESVR